MKNFWRRVLLVTFVAVMMCGLAVSASAASTRYIWQPSELESYYTKEKTTAKLENFYDTLQETNEKSFYACNSYSFNEMTGKFTPTGNYIEWGDNNDRYLSVNEYKYLISRYTGTVYEYKGDLGNFEDPVWYIIRRYTLSNSPFTQFCLAKESSYTAQISQYIINMGYKDCDQIWTYNEYTRSDDPVYRKKPGGETYEYVTSSSSSAYPSGGIKGNYWYELVGSDEPLSGMTVTSNSGMNYYALGDTYTLTIDRSGVSYNNIGTLAYTYTARLGYKTTYSGNYTPSTYSSGNIDSSNKVVFSGPGDKWKGYYEVRVYNPEVTVTDGLGYSVNINASLSGMTPDNILRAPTYTITLDPNGGTIASTTTTTTKTLNNMGTLETSDKLPSPTREGYVFAGWYTAKTGGDQITLTTVFSGNTTIYAQWTTAECEYTTADGTVTYEKFVDAWKKANTTTGGTIKLFTDIVNDRSGTVYFKDATSWPKGFYEYSMLRVCSDISVTLDLNGHDVDANLLTPQGSVIYIEPDGELILKDSVGDGRITGGWDKYYGGGIYTLSDGWDSEVARFVMYGGIITGNRTDSYEGGGGVYIDSGSEFEMHGGEICDNIAYTSGAGIGTCPYNSGNGKFALSVIITGDAYIHDNIVEPHPSHSDYDLVGGGIAWRNNGTFTISGNARIENNEADYGAGVYIGMGSATMSGGVISGNTAGADGGGVYVAADSSLSISGTTEITANKATRGGGIYVGGTLNLAGTPFIYDNAFFGKQSNIYLAKGKLVTISGKLTADTRFGVTTETVPTGTTPVVVTKNWPTKANIDALDVTPYVTSDKGYMARLNESSYEIEIAVTEYTITFNANGGSCSTSTATTDMTGKIATMPTPTRDGYEFLGWFDAQTGGNQVTSDTVFTAAKTVYARWKATQYAITYNLDGGTVSGTNPSSYTCEDSFTLINPTKPGYDFIGWSGTNLTDNTNQSVSVAAGSSGALSYTANWRARTDITYTVKHYTQTLDGTGYDLTETETLQGTMGTTVSAVSKVPIGFVENEGHANRVVSGPIAADGSLTLSLYYDRKSCTVTINPANGDAMVTQTVLYGNKLTPLSSLQRQGYIFSRWSDANGVTFDFATGLVFEDMTLTAIWTGAADTAYKVEHYQQSIDGTSYVFVDTQTFTGTTDTTVTGQPNSYEGFTADLNYGNVISMGVVQADGSLILRFYYDRKVMTVRMDPDNGDPIITKDCLYEQTVDAPEDPEKAGHTFDGWTEKAASASIDINDAQGLAIANMPAMASEPAPAAILMFNFTAPVKESLDLIAVYTTDSYTVTIDPKNGDEVITQTVVYNTCATEPDPKPTKPGYHFDSWRLPDGSEFSFNTPITGDITIEARILPNTDTPYKVEHYQQNVDRDGYTLAKTDNLTGTTDTITKVTVNSSLFAGFTENESHPDRKIMGTVTADGSLVLKLYYDRDGVIVTFDPDNGESTTQQSIAYGAVIAEPSAPTKSGYTFIGWQLDGAMWDFSQPVTGNITLKAAWVAAGDTPYKTEHYYQTVDGSGYELGDTKTLTGATGATVTAVPVGKTGFTESMTHTDRKVSGVIAADGSLVLKLYYDRNSYTITIDPDNGQPTTTQSVRHGAQAAIPAQPTRQGYDFAGWVDADGNAFDFNTPVTGALTIKASWTAGSGVAYKTEHYQQNADGSGYTLIDTDNLSGITGATVSAQAKTYEGFNVAMGNSNAVMSGVIAADGSLVLKVYYDRQTMTITLDLDNGQPALEITCLYGQIIPAPEAPVKPGYNFIGWQDVSDAGGIMGGMDIMVMSEPAVADNNSGEIDIPGLFDFSQPITKPLQLIAVYTAAGDTPYAVQHHQQKADGSGYDLFETENLTGATDNPVVALPKTYAGFHENTAHSDRVSMGVVQADGSLVLKLYYDRDDYVLTIDADNGSAVTTQSVSAGQKPVKPSNPVKSGYNFTGWFLPDGTEFDFNAIMTESKSIKAGWEVASGIIYTVERYRQTVDLSDYELFETKTYAGTVGQTVNATVEVYDGFTYDGDDPRQVASGVVQADNSLVLKLYYDRNTLTVTFDADNGSAATTQNVVYGSLLTKPADPVKQDYIFNGWYNGETAFDFSQPVMASMTLRAKWTAPSGVVYRIEHYKQTQTGYELFETETRDGTVGETVTAVPKSYDNFKENTTHTDRKASGVIAADGSLVLKLYYDHAPVKIDVDNNNGDESYELVVDYGGYVVKPEDPVKPGYVFVKWVDENGNEFDFENTKVYAGLSLTAVWEVASDVVYKVEHYQQNTAGDGYTLYQTETLTGVTDTTAMASAKTFTGFTENKTHASRVASGVIAADGSLVLKLYYDRVMLTVTIDPDNGTAVQTLRVRYGALVNKPADPKKDRYEFVNWVDAKGNVFDFSKSVYANVALKPTWNEIKPPEVIPETGLSSGSVIWMLASMASTACAIGFAIPVLGERKRREHK